MLHRLSPPSNSHLSGAIHGTKSETSSLAKYVMVNLSRNQIIGFLSISSHFGALVLGSLPALGLAQATSADGYASATVVEPTSLSQVGEWVVGAHGCSLEAMKDQCAGQFELRGAHASEFSLNVQYIEEATPRSKSVKLEEVRIESNASRNSTAEKVVITIAASPATENQLSSELERQSLLVQISYH